MANDEMMTSSNVNIFRVTGPLWGESTGHRCIPLTKARDADLKVIMVCLGVLSTSNYELKSQFSVIEHTNTTLSSKRMFYEYMSLRQKDFLKLIFPLSAHMP